MSIEILPDSRLEREDLGSKMVDWVNPDGTVERIEVVKIYCANCGKLYGYVPRENTVFVCWMCKECHAKLSKDGGLNSVLFEQPDEEFCRAVGHEMTERFGRTLTDAEVYEKIQDHSIGPALEALIKDSPYPSQNSRKKE